MKIEKPRNTEKDPLSGLDKSTSQGETSSRSECPYEIRRSHQQQYERHQGLLNSLGTRYRSCCLEGFEFYGDDGCVERQRKAHSLCSAYAEKYEKCVNAGFGLVFYGPTGTGKDHLMAALLRGMSQRGVWCKFIDGESLWEQVRDSIDTKTPGSTLTSHMVAPAVLAISDPISQDGGLSSHQRRVLYHIVNLRYSRKKPTYVTINVSCRDEMNAALGAPLTDRLIDNSIVIPCDWPSHRGQVVLEDIENL